jgi:predicted amidohydrolase YtcJ
MSARILILLALMPSAVVAQGEGGPPDLIVLNARIHTADPDQPLAQALAVRDGRFLLVGTNREIENIAGPGTERLEAAGGTIVPGMIDAHAHLLSLGRSLRVVDLRGTSSYEEVIALIRARADEIATGTWIRGRGWDQNDWPGGEFPNHEALSQAVPDHPVYLDRVDGHAALVNQNAIYAAHLNFIDTDPVGGRILRNPNGSPTGVLIDNATLIVDSIIPAPSRKELTAQLVTAMAEFNRWGVTGIHDAGVGVDTIAFYQELAADGRFTLRNYAMVDAGSPGLVTFLNRGPQSGLHDAMLWTRAIKISSDGAMGSRGAALLYGYADDPDNEGLLLASYDSVLTIARLALERGFQVNVHAIGDRANRVVLDAFETALRERPTPGHRFRIEHAQVLSEQDIPRFAQLGVIPSMQGSHQTSDMYWVLDRLGNQRVLGAYVWHSLRETGVIIPNGSDAPVESANPLISFRAFFTRQDAEGWPEGGWFPEQRISRQEALLSMTLWPAQAAFMEQEVGSITAGKLADFVVLDTDIMTVPEDQILGTRVKRTFVGGKPVYPLP